MVSNRHFDIKIGDCVGHRFIFEINTDVLYLSCKPFHGYKNVIRIGNNGFQKSIISAISLIQNVQPLYDFFKLFEMPNGLMILESVCKDDFLAYWKERAQLYSVLHSGDCCLRSVFHDISGLNSSRIKYGEYSLATSMNDICIQIAKKYCRTLCDKNLYRLNLIQKVSGYIGSKEICVESQGYYNNSALFQINNIPVSFCSNRTKEFKQMTADWIYSMCGKILIAVLKFDNISRFTNRLGGSFVFRIMSILCPSESIIYFEKVAEYMIKQRKKVFPRQIIKHFNLHTVDPNIQSFINEILSSLENIANQQGGFLISDNNIEIKKDDKWVLFYSINESIYRCIFDFTLVKNTNLRKEIIQYLRYLYSLKRNENYLYHCFRALYRGVNALEQSTQKEYSSITDVSLTNAYCIKVYLEQVAKTSIPYMQRTFFSLNQLFSFSSTHLKVSRNPFELVKINRSLAQGPVLPLSNNEKILVRDNIKNFPEHIQLALQCYLILGARGNEVCNLKISSLIYDAESKKYALRVFLYKTALCKQEHDSSNFIDRTIPDALALNLISYIHQTDNLRVQLQTDLLFVYLKRGCRSGSKLMPMILKSDSVSFYLKKLSNLQESMVPTKGYDSMHYIGVRRIRATYGAEMLKKGYTPQQVADVLGNTSAVVAKHYSQITPESEAEKRSRLYSESLGDVFEKIRSPNITCSPTKENCQIMYGTCCNPKECTNNHDCSSCPELIKCHGS